MEKKKRILAVAAALVVSLSSCTGLASSGTSPVVSDNSATPGSATGDYSLPASGSSTSSSASAAEPESYITVFSVNDMHGKLKADQNYPGILNLEASIKHNSDYSEGNSLIISDGDMWQGGYVSGYDKGLGTTELMSAFPFEAMSLGNHEFDWGFDILTANAAQTDFPFLCANLVQKSTGARPEPIKDHVVLEQDGFKVGIVGAIGATLESTIKASMITDFEFSDDLALIQTAADACRDEGAQAVLLALHDDEYSSYTENIRSDNSLGLDGIFGGHSHQFQLSDDGRTPYVQGGCDSKGYSWMKIEKSTGQVVKVANLNLKNSGETYGDSDYNQLLKEKLEAQIANVPIEPFNKIQGNWSQKATANFVTKAMFEMTKTLLPDRSYSESNLVAVHNTGGIRASFPYSYEPMDLTMDQIQAVSPFDNKVVILTDKTIDFRELDGYCYSCPDSSELSRTAAYDIVTIDFLLGDAYSDMFAGAYEELDAGDDTAYIIFELIADYAKSLPTPIMASDYTY